MTRARRPAPARAPADDKHDLYELAVQSPTQAALFLHAAHAGNPKSLCDDFCGAGAVARAFTRAFPNATATAIDKDSNALKALKARCDEHIAERIVARKADVLTSTSKADIIAALNFPVGYFHDRPSLLAYCKRARSRLRPRGVLVIDTYGGPTAFQIGRYEVRLDNGVRYTWEQREANPLSARVLNAMHFDLPGGKSLRDAFVYDWRLWSVPELRDALAEAGFTSVEVYLSMGSAIDAKGRLRIEPSEAPDNLDDDFVAYLVARR